MSLKIDIEKFSSWSEIFRELEKHEKSKKSPPKVSETVKESTAGLFSVREREATTHHKMGRLPSEGEAISQKRVPNPSLSRQTSLPCYSGSTFNAAKVRADPRLTDAAANLSHEELALLYEDVLKPLDFYSMLHERRKQSQGTQT